MLKLDRLLSKGGLVGWSFFSRQISISVSRCRSSMDRHNSSTIQPLTSTEAISFHTLSATSGHLCASNLKWEISLLRNVKISSAGWDRISFWKEHKIEMPNWMQVFQPYKINKCQSLLTKVGGRSSEKRVMNQLVANIYGSTSRSSRCLQTVGTQLKMYILSTYESYLSPCMLFKISSPSLFSAMRKQEQ